MTNVAHALRRPDRWGEQILDTFPLDLRGQALARWIEVANIGPTYPGLRHKDGFAPHARANLELGALKRELEQIKFSVATDDADIAETALTLADMCARRNLSGVLIAEHFGIELQWPKRATHDSIQRRFCDPRWWRKKLRAHVGRSIEETMRKRGLVRFGKAAYLTDWSLRRWRGQRAAARYMLENSVVVNEEGTQLDLCEVSSKSVSNPELRRKEMMLRAKGFEKQAIENGYTWTFATLTCPSAFHPQLKAGGDNPRYEGFSVREGQQWLCERWELSRSALDRESIRIFGFRVAEPNHDGTPHWHALIFVKPEQLERLEEVLTAQWLSEYAGEFGAADHRTSFERENAKRPGSSAAGYIAKYIGKNIDGHGVDECHETSLSGAESAERATAWASVHGIRQFQQLGGPAVGLWRELRRLREPVLTPEIEAARIHTNKPACWSSFIDAIGGIAAGRKTSLQLWKREPLQRNRYGERRGPQIIGICAAKRTVRTRLHEWRIEWRDSLHAFFSSLGPVSITVRGGKHPAALNSEAFVGETGPPWAGRPGKHSDCTGLTFQSVPEAR